ncbi:MAG: alpha-L-rhamnosidase C-terminal domain-containing protein, partial [Paludibacter sp.]
NTYMVKHPLKTSSPIKYGNVYRLELNDQLYEGVRFGWIHVRKFAKPFTIKNVRLICQIKPTNYEGSFSCSNPMLNKIWYTGAYTVKLNFLKDYFGAILMDRGDRYSWTGDAHISQYVSLLAFGNADFVKVNLVRTANDANGIASYSLYWVQSLIDYYNYTNDKVLFDNYIKNACGKLDTASMNFGRNTNLGFFGWDERLGAGFETPNCNENQLALKMLTIGTLRAYSEALRADEKVDLANKYSKLADEKTEQLRSNQLWFSPMGLHAATDAVNALDLSVNEQSSIWQHAFPNRLQRVSFSPFNEYFVVKAMANLNKYSEALTTIDDCWGGQIRNGATTTYEIYHPSWNTVQPPLTPPVSCQYGYTSLAHPWSAGATRWLSEEILGIKPTSPGFKMFTFKPHLSSKVTSVTGKVPTTFGAISASFDIKSGNGNVEIPAGTAATVAIPKAGMKIMGVKFNKNAISISKEDTDFVYFENIKSGIVNISVHYEGKLKKAEEEKFEYPYTN